jgi:carbon-monoxide dehydrogenase medium subunit
MKLRLASPAALIDIGRIAQLRGIESTQNGLHIGALTTHSEVAASDLVKRQCPVLASTAGNIGDQQVRNRGTIGGWVAHADPGADYPTVLRLLDAKFHAADGNPRDIDAADFFVDLFTTALKPGELLTGVTIPPTDGASAVYLKHRHPASSFAVVGVGVMVRIHGGKFEDVRISIGGATAVPVRARTAEAALNGQIPSEAGIASAAESVAGELQDPFGDSYASGEFRAHLATVMTKRALTQLAWKAR